jgi:VCBS repeat-containing protein
MGTATITVTGNSATLSASTTINLAITPTGSFTISANPTNLSVVQGTTTITTITVSPQGGFNGNVSLSTSGLPNGVTAAFNPSATTGSATLTLAAGAGATLGSATITITGTCVGLTSSTTVALTVTPAPNPNLPSAWLDQDVGSVSRAGTAAYAGGKFTVKASGTWIYDVADSMHFVYQPLSGDGTIMARVLSASGSATPEVGVMIRETLSPGSTHAYVCYQAYPNGSIHLYARITTGGSTSSQYSSILGLPYWVKLVRSGNTFTGYSSLDGINWAQVGSTQTISMAQNVYVGLAVSADDNTSLATGVFDSVSVTSSSIANATITGVSATTGAVGNSVVITGTGFGATQNGSAVTVNDAPLTITNWSATSITAMIPSGATSGPLVVVLAPAMNDSNPVPFAVTSQPLPSPWLDRDIGTVTVAGNATYSGTSFTLNASGGWIYDVADGLHFVYQPMTGDGTIIARVLSASGSNYPQAGVMIRETMAANSTEAFGGYQPYPGASIHLYARTTTGGSTSSQYSSIPGLPYWVKLVRSGSTFTAYASPDGMSWTQVASQTITMAQTVCVGLALSANDNSGPFSTSVATASFDNLTLTQP